jgi:hypothetical protein
MEDRCGRHFGERLGNDQAQAGHGLCFGPALSGRFEPLHEGVTRNQDSMPEAKVWDFVAVDGGIESAAADFVFSDEDMRLIDGERCGRFPICHRAFRFVLAFLFRPPYIVYVRPVISIVR